MNKNYTKKEILENLNNVKNISEIINLNFKKFPNKIFIYDFASTTSTKITYKMFNEYVNNCCLYLKTKKIKKGDVISVFLNNSVTFLIIYFASLRSGIIINPIPTTLNKSEVLEKLKFIKPKIVFSCIKIHFKKNIIVSEDLKLFLKTIKNNKKYIFSPVTNKKAVFYFSSGTTGKSKIIEYSNNAILENQKSLIMSNFFQKKNTHICFLPLFHTASLRYTVKYILSTAGTLLLFKNFWNIKDSIWKIVNKYSVNYFQTVPTIINTLLNGKKIKINKKIKFIGCGSATLTKKTILNFEKKFKIKISNLYGLSEIGCSHFDDPHIKFRVVGSIGKILPGFRYKIFKSKKLDLNKSGIGELGVKSKSCLSNYYKNTIAFKKNHRQGYFMTGDYVYKNKNDIFFYVDRKKDLIIKGGVNIAPSDIEKKILSYKSVAEVAITAMPDMFYGEDICCFVVPKSSSININNLDDYCKKILGEFKKPKKYVILSQLPKTSSGKILKNKLRSSLIDE